MPQSHLNFYVPMTGSITAKVGLHNTYPVPPLWYKTCSRHILSLHTNRHTIVEAQRDCYDVFRIPVQQAAGTDSVPAGDGLRQVLSR